MRRQHRQRPVSATYLAWIIQCSSRGEVFMRGVLCLCILSTLALIAPVAAETPPAKLRVTIQVAATDPFLGAGVVQFKNELEREAANGLSVEIFDQGKLYIDDQVIGAVKSGAIEM